MIAISNGEMRAVVRQMRGVMWCPFCDRSRHETTPPFCEGCRAEFSEPAENPAADAPEAPQSASGGRVRAK
jgi:ribosomal protein L37AE/L43A